MSPSKREQRGRSRLEREHARQRYAKWQERQDERALRRRKGRQIALLVGTTVVVLAVVAGVFWLTQRGNETTTEATATPVPSSSDASNPCPSPTVTPPATPQRLTAPNPSLAENRTWTATIQTSCGPIGLELYGEKAPKSVASFVQLARAGFFAGTPCHRLTTQGIYVLQCGDPTGTGTGGPGYEWGPVENAPADDVYPAGTLAMARQGGKADSQGSQFFLVYKDSTIPSDAAGGYSVFGRVTSGLDIVQKIAEGGLASDGVAPARAISIEGVTVQ
ncbi:MAG: peptidylprolyl isomerase [Actinomycetes bacterium]